MAKKVVHYHINKTKKYKNIKTYKSEGYFTMSTILVDRTPNNMKANHLKIIFKKSNNVNKKDISKKEAVTSYMEAWQSLTDEEKDYADILAKRND